MVRDSYDTRGGKAMRKYANISASNIVLDEKSKAELMRSEHISEDEILEPLKLLPGYIKDIREYRLITPLFGGGVETLKSDPISIIRETEIRGQLRFWWRASRSWQYTSIKEMKEAEDTIWGKAHTTQKRQTEDNGEPVQEDKNQTIQISVKVTNNGTTVDTSAAPEYLTFALRDEGGKLRENVRFNLHITYPQIYNTEIEAALWAWETFGGIGARTRRGFGALHLKKSSLQPQLDRPKTMDPKDIKKWINDKLNKFIQRNTFPNNVPHLSYPHLSKNLTYDIVPSPKDKDISVWDELSDRLKDFRQKKNKGKKWLDKKHAVDVQDNGIKKEAKFPKATIGLPLVFQFPDKEDNITIQGGEEGQERFASPLIIRPYTWQNSGPLCGIVLLLEGTQIPKSLEIIGKPQKLDPNKKRIFSGPEHTTLTNEEAKNIPALNGQVNVLQQLFHELTTNTNNNKNRKGR
jgi:CRISPR-associated protein Cmr1